MLRRKRKKGGRGTKGKEEDDTDNDDEEADLVEQQALLELLAPLFRYLFAWLCWLVETKCLKFGAVGEAP